MIKLSNKMREHIRNQNKGDVVIDKTRWWLVGRQGYTCNLVFVNSAMDVMYMKDTELMCHYRQNMDVRFNGSYIKAVSFCDSMQVDLDIIILGILLLSNKYVYDILTYGGEE